MGAIIFVFDGSPSQTKISKGILQTLRDFGIILGTFSFSARNTNDVILASLIHNRRVFLSGAGASRTVETEWNEISQAPAYFLSVRIFFSFVVALAYVTSLAKRAAPK